MNNACFGKKWKDSTDPESSFNTTNNNVPRLRKKKLKLTEFLKIGKEFNIFSEYKISCKKKNEKSQIVKRICMQKNCRASENGYACRDGERKRDCLRVVNY